jgi:hypothetical protein
MPRTRRRIKKRKTNKHCNVKQKKCVCKCNCKNCGKRIKGKIKKCKKCVKKRCCCIAIHKKRTVKKRRVRRIKKKLRKYGQRGCSQKGCRQRGGAMLNVGKKTFECDDAMNMGEIRSGSKYNDHGTHDLTSKTTQNDMVLQSGGGLGMLSEKFGLGQAATSLRNMQNSFVNGYRSWNGDHKVASADVTVAHENMKYN